MGAGSRLYPVAKRVIDIAGASAALVIAAPLMLAVAVAIKLESPGPVLFRQTRVGRNGRPFMFLKFRSMQSDAPLLRMALNGRNETTGPVFKIRADPRVTRIGRFVRKYSLDELPQLWHVLSGGMSLVGPRPPLLEEVVRYEPWQTERLAVTPGLTCTWQVSGRSNIPFDRWVEMDIAYIRHRSLLLDLQLLLRTVPAVITGRGAY